MEKNETSKAEVTYSWRGLKRDKYKISKFYVMVKVHKKSNKLRPIVWYLHMVLCSLTGLVLPADISASNRLTERNSEVSPTVVRRFEFG